MLFVNPERSIIWLATDVCFTHPPVLCSNRFCKCVTGEGYPSAQNEAKSCYQPVFDPLTSPSPSRLLLVTGFVNALYVKDVILQRSINMTRSHLF